MSDGSWHPFSYQLTFRLGEISLGTVDVPVLRRVYRLREILSSPSFPVLPPLADEEAGYFVASLPVTGTAGELSDQSGFIGYCVKAYVHSSIDLSQTFDAYQAGFSGKTRSTLKRKVRKFAESAGDEHFRRYADPDDMAEFFRHAREVSARSYQERLLKSGLPDHEGFLAELEAAAARDEVRGYLLFHRGEPVSYLYCPVADGVLIYSHLGYLPEYASLSAGTVLQWLALQSLFDEQRFFALDFTEGDSDQKRLFGTQQTPCSHHLLLRPTSRNRLMLRAHRGVDRFSGRVGAALDQYGLKTRVRRWIRGMA